MSLICNCNVKAGDFPGIPVKHELCQEKQGKYEF